MAHDKTIIRVEKYKATEESVEVKEAVAYGRDTSKMFCWYNFEEWKKCFKEYKELKGWECTFINGEIFTWIFMQGHYGENTPLPQQKIGPNNNKCMEGNSRSKEKEDPEIHKEI